MSRRATYRSWRRLGFTMVANLLTGPPQVPGPYLYECPRCFAAVTNPGRHDEVCT